MKNKSRYLISILLFVLLFSIFYSISESKPSKVIIIEEELSSVEVIDKLYSEGFIQNRPSYWLLRLNAKINNSYQIGGFELKEKMGALALHSRLIDPVYKYVYVEEGLRTEEIAEIMGSDLEWNYDKVTSFSRNFLFCSETNANEGFLHPGKYAIHRDEIVSIIKKEMSDEAYEYIKEISNENNPGKINEIITIASLIQKEAGGKNDMRLISGVIANRLSEEMPLQIDATLQYVKGDNESWWPRVHPKDKYLESPYNTYENEGLPPTAIANPGKSAIYAALNPLPTDCIFYIHDKRGNIHCSSTYEGHKNNIDYYLK